MFLTLLKNKQPKDVVFLVFKVIAKKKLYSFILSVLIFGKSKRLKG